MATMHAVGKGDKEEEEEEEGRRQRRGKRGRKRRKRCGEGGGLEEKDLMFHH
jgi:hypothetical protein